MNLDDGRTTEHLPSQPSLVSTDHPVNVKLEKNKLDVKTSKSAYIRAALKAFAASVLISPVGLVVAPMFAFILLLFGIAALPHWDYILVPSTMVVVLMPGISINIYLTRGIPIIYRVTSVIFYLAVFVFLEIAFFVRWIFEGVML